MKIVPNTKEKFCINCGRDRLFIDRKEGVENKVGEFFCSHCGIYESYNEILRNRQYGVKGIPGEREVKR